MPKNKFKKRRNRINICNMPEFEINVKEEQSIPFNTPKKIKKKKLKSYNTFLAKTNMRNILIIFLVIILVLFILYLFKYYQLHNTINQIKNIQKEENKLKNEMKKQKNILEKYESKFIKTKLNKIEKGNEKGIMNMELEIKGLKEEKKYQEIRYNQLKKELKDLYSKIKKLFGIEIIPQEKKFKIEEDKIDDEIKEPTFFELNYLDVKEDVKLEKIERYIKMCKKDIILVKKDEDFTKKPNPKISIIIPIYNNQNLLSRVLRSIQNQSFKDIEIIFVNDHSTDDSKKKIEEFKAEDKRIILISNEENKGTFYSVNKGVFKASGEYIQILDVNCFAIEDILKKAYMIANIKKLDIIQYMMVIEKNGNKTIINYKNKNKYVYQPELSDLIFNNKQYQTFNYFFISDKLIKKSVYLQSLELIGEKYLEKRIDINENLISLYAIHKVAKSYLFLEKAGLYYLDEEKFSSLNEAKKSSFTNHLFYSLFTQLKFFIDKTLKDEKDNKYGFLLYSTIKNKYENLMNFLTEGFDFFNEVLNLYLKCPFYNNVLKESINIFIKKVIQIKNRKR